jgi:hypothetical protein
MRSVSSSTWLNAKYSSFSYGNVTVAFQPSKRFLERFSFLSLGMVARASKIVFCATSA